MKNREDFEWCAQRLKALAEPERLRIVTSLASGPLNVGELAEKLREDIVKVSHHLGVLRNVGLVACKKEGRFVVYSLHPQVAADAKGDEGALQIDLGCCQFNLPESGQVRDVTPSQ